MWNPASTKWLVWRRAWSRSYASWARPWAFATPARALAIRPACSGAGSASRSDSGVVTSGTGDEDGSRSRVTA